MGEGDEGDEGDGTDTDTDRDIAGIGIDASPGVLLSVAIVLAVFAAALHVVLARASVALGERVAVNSRQRLIGGFLDA